MFILPRCHQHHEAPFHRGFLVSFASSFLPVATPKPLTDPMKKYIKFNFGDSERAAFQTLKSKIIEQPVLAIAIIVLAILIFVIAVVAIIMLTVSVAIVVAPSGWLRGWVIFAVLIFLPSFLDSVIFLSLKLYV